MIVPLIARAWLREEVPPRLWPALGLGFLGIVLILRPGVGIFRPAALAALVAAVLAALAQVGVRRLTQTEPISRIVFYFASISTVVSGLPLFKAWTTPEPHLWPVLVALGVLATLAQLVMTGTGAVVARMPRRRRSGRSSTARSSSRASWTGGSGAAYPTLPSSPARSSSARPGYLRCGR